ncbi:MAG: hypothetical protein WAL59_04600 [Roseiarcus sp.]
MRLKGGDTEEKIWKPPNVVWKSCNPLKSHKTTKELFGKAWTKTAWIWKSLEESLEACLYFAAFARTRGSAWPTSAIACSAAAGAQVVVQKVAEKGA